MIKGGFADGACPSLSPAGEQKLGADKSGINAVLKTSTHLFLAIIIIMFSPVFSHGQGKHLFDVISFTDDMSFDWQQATPQPLPGPLEDYAIRTGKEEYQWALEHEPDNITQGSGEEYFQGLYEYRILDERYKLWVYVPGPDLGAGDGFFCVEDMSSGKISRPYVQSIRFANTNAPMIQYRDFDNDGTRELIIKHIRHCGTNCTWVTDNYYNILPGPCLKRIFALETFGFWYDDRFPFKGFDSNDTCERSAIYDKRNKAIKVTCVFERDLSYQPDGKLLRKTFQIKYIRDPSNGKYYPTRKSFTKKYSALISTQDDITSREIYEEVMLNKARGDYLGTPVTEIRELGRDISCEVKESRTIGERIILDDILKLQKAVDEGHQPWRLDAISVAAVKLKALDPGIDEMDCKMEESTETKATVTCDKGKRYSVHLERLVRHDGIWTVISVEISDK